MTRFSSILCLSTLVTALLAAPAANAGSMNMSTPDANAKVPMPMADTPAHFKPTRVAYTTDHRFLVKLLALPAPIPYEKYFTVRLAAYQARPPHKQVMDAKLKIFAGMRHGRKHGFAHGMQSSPKLVAKRGVVTVSGMYFHMMGPWVLKATVERGGRSSIAYFELPCCGQ